uniref:Uncharacterized protein n=1 Tax=Anguilla anguilla TaxID=7936 RepID=A0A0E9TR27_ANGAN
MCRLHNRYTVAAVHTGNVFTPHLQKQRGTYSTKKATEKKHQHQRRAPQFK